jgi:F-type H+-transporting ATPase subunit delta
MEEIAEVYSRALFEVAQQHGALDRVHDELGEFADALERDRDLRLFFFSPYFSSEEKRDGIERVLDGANEHFMRFLGLLAERHRLPVIHRVRRRFDELWAEERQLINVEITSAVEVDKRTAKSIGDQIREETGRDVELSTKVDPEILGGVVIRVGNKIMDASVRTKLDNLRRQVATAG